MACKDCINFESCKNLYETHGDGLSGDSYICGFFKDHSRFVELPCKLGDTVYYFNSAGEIFLQEVNGFIVNFVGILVDSDVMFYSYMMGDRFFSTYEEAKQAFKEREANANDLPQSDNHS